MRRTIELGEGADALLLCATPTSHVYNRAANHDDSTAFYLLWCPDALQINVRAPRSLSDNPELEKNYGRW